MEEKERFELFGEFGIIHDTSPNAECMLLNKFQTCEILNKQDKENQQLKQQLAEKDKEIVRLNKFLQAMKIREHNQDEISFAIEQLEKVKEFFLKEHRDEEMDTDYIITKNTGEIADYLLDQIKQLKEKNNATRKN